MTKLHIEAAEGSLPTFSLDVGSSKATAIYSDVDLQEKLMRELLRNPEVDLFDYKEGLYERLTVQDNIKFYNKWFGCRTTLPELLVMFQLQNCAKMPLRKCSPSQIRRVLYAKHYMSNAALNVFQEPIQGVDVLTINTFINMLKQMMEEKRNILVLVSSMEHALLLGDDAYHLQDSGLIHLETDAEEEQEIAKTSKQTSLTVEKLFKIPAKIDDKVILFDPTEIDYIESQEGKAFIVINGDAFPLDATLTEIEKKLELYGFYRCHRSYIVNLQKVREIITWSKNTYSLKINNKVQATIPLSRTKIQTIQEIFNLK
ncbi:LytTR family transcriptional regulator DNA-binding domain-containing protein [Virgibacillus sp. 179-BFC.A HS]|uniref:LytTR family transcriptional regulator DNA-binding domain-containing protein n=1 Tax=Tigheibacillus jepli TaxID=3035914 RepID=A0ABU5CEV9_9BACI|nr:response regulator transcription factor [Virgibacillus sp. 179-BFC.A HS]MDY0404369.1 LytTR family transcriptional regulator DNA-binding domain-containing protein [Virgibacillus sp. 179-BFC.A HS]